MKDIKKGIELEQQYLESKEKGLEFSLLEALKTAGYFNLNDYFEDKKQYQLSHCNIDIQYAPIEDAITVLYKMISNKKPGLLIVPSDKVFIYHGTEPYNEEYCKANNIIIHEVGHRGGNIVGSEKDLSLGFIIPKEIDIDSLWILNRYARAFNRLGLPVVVDNNDLLLNGDKILGSAIIEAEDFFIHVSNISFGDSSKLVEKICQVPRKKQPNAIPASVSRESFTKEVLLWLS